MDKYHVALSFAGEDRETVGWVSEAKPNILNVERSSLGLPSLGQMNNFAIFDVSSHFGLKSHNATKRQNGQYLGFSPLLE